MNPDQKDPFDLTDLLQDLQPGRRADEREDTQANYRDLLRYTLQLAAERQAAADVLVELRELLEQYAPAWYAAEQHQRVESTLELLQRL